MGFEQAYWVLIVVPLIPICSYFLLVKTLVDPQVREKPVLSLAAQQRSGQGEEDTGDVELFSMEEFVRNPAHAP